MEELKNYRTIAKELLFEIVSRKNKPGRATHYQLVEDKHTGNFLIIRNGWHGGQRLYNIIIHVEVKDDSKVWVQQDATDLIIADLLLEKGIKPEDLVLGFLAPAMRADMELQA